MGDCAKNLRNKRDRFYGLCSTTYREHRDYHDDIQKKQQLYHFLPLMTKLTKLPSNQRKINLRHLCGFNSFLSVSFSAKVLHPASLVELTAAPLQCIDCTLTAIPSIQPGLDGFASTLAWSSFQYSQHGNVLRTVHGERIYVRHCC